MAIGAFTKGQLEDFPFFSSGGFFNQQNNREVEKDKMANMKSEFWVLTSKY
jgi:hypothetical protein